MKTPLKVLHVAFMPGPGLGARQQMSMEVRAAGITGLPWAVTMYVPQGVEAPDNIVRHSDLPAAGRSLIARLLYWHRLRREFYSWLAREVANHDVILLRHSTSSPHQARFIRQCPKPVFTVHHSSEGPELASQRGLASRLKWLLEMIFGRMSMRACAGVIGLTPEILDYERARARDGVPGFLWPNGVDFSSEGAGPDARTDDEVELLFVASHFYNWHGLDRLLDSIERSDASFRLHLVGSLSDEDARRCERDPRIQCHGFLSHEAIDALSERCWAGLSSMALDRKNMTQACTLKVRQYLRAGLPVYSGHADVFDVDFPFYRNGPADIAQIIEYARSVRQYSRADVSAAAEPHVSKAGLVARLHGQLSEVVDTMASGTNA